MEHCKKPVPKKGLVFSFLSATLLLSCLSGFGLLEFFLSATLLLNCLSGFGLLEFFLSATLLLAAAVGSLIAFCWLCRWLVYFPRVAPARSGSGQDDRLARSTRGPRGLSRRFLTTVFGARTGSGSTQRHEACRCISA